MSMLTRVLATHRPDDYHGTDADYWAATAAAQGLVALTDPVPHPTHPHIYMGQVTAPDPTGDIGWEPPPVSEPTGDAALMVARHEVRGAARVLARALLEVVPDGPARQEALRRLAEVCRYAEAGLTDDR